MSAMCSAPVLGIVGDDGREDGPALRHHRRLLARGGCHVGVRAGVVAVRHRQSDRRVIQDLVGSLGSRRN